MMVWGRKTVHEAGLISMPPMRTRKAQGVPAAGFTDLLHFKEGLTGVPVLQIPCSIRVTLFFEQVNRWEEPLIPIYPALLKIVKRHQNVVMPARGKEKRVILRSKFSPVWIDW